VRGHHRSRERDAELVLPEHKQLLPKHNQRLLTWGAAQGWAGRGPPGWARWTRGTHSCMGLSWNDGPSPLPTAVH